MFTNYERELWAQVYAAALTRYGCDSEACASIANAAVKEWRKIVSSGYETAGASSEAVAAAWEDMKVRNYDSAPATLFVAHMKERIAHFAARQENVEQG